MLGILLEYAYILHSFDVFSQLVPVHDGLGQETISHLFCTSRGGGGGGGGS